jgi:hypothetical protein
VLLAHIPNDRICVTPQASFGFHLAHRPDATATLWAAYNAGIREWINSRGGLTADFKWMRAPDIYRFFRKCSLHAGIRRRLAAEDKVPPMAEA